MNIIVIILAGALALNLHPTYASEPTPHKDIPAEKDVKISSGLKKINDSLYVGKVEDEFYVAMERVTRTNLELWQNYGEEQQTTAEATHAVRGKEYTLSHLIDGSQCFNSALTKYAPKHLADPNEVWVAYTSRAPVRERATTATADANIEMFMSVLTSRDALFSTHMGIARDWGTELDLLSKEPKRKKHPYQSLHLHSFAAKVMLLRDPKKVYMITTPAPSMLEIFAKKFPADALFIGDNGHKEALEEAISSTSQVVDQKKLTEQRKILALMKSHPSRINIKGKLGQNRVFTIFNLSGKKELLTFDEHSKIYPWINTPCMQKLDILIPFVAVDLRRLAAFGRLR